MPGYSNLLLQLPGELRNRIYDLLLEMPLELDLQTSRRIAHPAISLSMTCRKIATELSPYIRQHGLFRIIQHNNPFQIHATLRDELVRCTKILREATNVEILRVLHAVDTNLSMHQQVLPQSITHIISVFSPWPVAATERPQNQRIYFRVICEGLFPSPREQDWLLGDNSFLQTAFTTAKPFSLSVPGPSWVAQETMWTEADLFYAWRLSRFLAMLRSDIIQLVPGIKDEDIWLAGEAPKSLKLMTSGQSIYFRQAGGREGRVIWSPMFGAFVKEVRRVATEE